MTKTWNTERLPALGFRRVMKTEHGEAWVRMQIRNDWAVGECVLALPGFATRIQCAFDMTLLRLEAMGALAEDPEFVRAVNGEIEVGGGFGSALKRLGKRFKAKVNHVAAAIAKGKIINKLRKAYAKVLQGPLGDLGVEAGARALSIFGVPAAATRLAINQRRFAQVDRLKHGGWAGMIERATGKEGLKGVLREAAQRNLEAGKKSLSKALPLGLNLGKLANMADKKVAESTVSGDWSWLADA